MKTMNNEMMKCDQCGSLFNPAFLDQVFEHEHNGMELNTIIKGVKVWQIGDKFKCPETGDKVFTVIEVSEYYVEARDARSCAGITSFLKSYITPA